MRKLIALFLTLVIAMTIAMVPAVSAAASAPENLVANGSFENPPATLHDYSLFNNGTPDLGWAVGWVNSHSLTPRLEVQNQMYGSVGYDGNQWIELAADYNNTIYENVPTWSGQAYVLSFACAPRPGFFVDGRQVQVKWNGQTVFTTAFQNINPSVVSWDYHQIVVTGAGATTELRFTQLGTDSSIGTLLDAVSVTAIPLVANGSFEKPDVAHDTYVRFQNVADTDWNSSPNSNTDQGLEIQDTDYAYEGYQFAELDAVVNTEIWQNISTTAGRTYQLQFAWSGRPNETRDNQIEVKWNGLTIFTSPLVETAAWQEESFLVLATGAATELKFHQLGTSDGLGTYLDDISLVPAATPDPIPTPSDIVISGPIDPVQKGASADFSATFTDSPLVANMAEWSWGDGSTSIGTVDQTADKVGTISHAYASAGIYTVSLKVTNSLGKSATGYSSTLIVVYDPEGGTGFVTGGGWIDSPAGADKVNTTATGKANFGFVSKYQKGATIPTGNTEFQFKEGDLNFKSTSYEWLVVSGTQAQFKGVGTINGGGNYEFMLTAIDGDLINSNMMVDAFRIKITDLDTGLLRYDNGRNSPLGGGSIVIHK